MAYSYLFFDNQMIGAEDMNRAVQLFVSGGVADHFQNDLPYSISKLGDMIFANASTGIVPETNQTLRVEAADGTAYIQPGVAFFDDGTVITVESTETVAYTAGQTAYIYLKSDVQENRAYPAASAEMPTGNVVLLAEITPDGQVIDRRRYARGKVPSMYASDAGLFMFGTHTVQMGDTSVPILNSGNTYQNLIIRCYNGVRDNPTWISYTVVDLANNRNDNFTTRRVSFGETADGLFTMNDSLNTRVVWGSFGGAGIHINGTLVPDDAGGISMNIALDRPVEDSFLRYYVYPFTVEVYGF